MGYLAVSVLLQHPKNFRAMRPAQPKLRASTTTILTMECPKQSLPPWRSAPAITKDPRTQMFFTTEKRQSAVWTGVSTPRSAVYEHGNPKKEINRRMHSSEVTRTSFLTTSQPCTFNSRCWVGSPVQSLNKPRSHQLKELNSSSKLSQRTFLHRQNLLLYKVYNLWLF